MINLEQSTKVNQIIDEQIKENAVHVQLTLVFRKIGDEGIQYLCGKNTNDIQQLNLAINQISSLGILHMSRVNWNNLKVLNLPNNPIGNKGCKNLSKTKLSSIQMIYLTNNSIDSAGILHLSKSQWIQRIYELQLSLNYFSDRSIHYLAKARWNKMKQIDISFNPIEKGQILYFLLAQTKQEVMFRLDNKWNSRLVLFEWNQWFWQRFNQNLVNIFRKYS